MKDAGYTLTETLAAMAVIGLAIGGYSLGVQVISAQQGVVGALVLDTQEGRAMQVWLERRLADHAPYRAAEPARFLGDADGFHFDCGAAAPCSVEVTVGDAKSRLSIFKGAGEPVTFQLPNAQPARFTYRGSGEAGSRWPPADAPHQALSSVALLQGADAHERAVFEVRVRAEQPLNCQFDTVAQDCR